MLFSLETPKTDKKEGGYTHFKISVIFKKEIVVFLTSAVLMLASHGAYYGFFSIHLENLGFSAAFTGISWALASVSEIFVMLNSRKIFDKFSIKTILVFSFLMAGIRWFTLFFAKSGVIILLTQITHAATYGAFHIASILYIDQLVSDEAKTVGQAVNNALTYGFGMMMGFFASGWLYDRLGSQALFALSGCVALIGGLTLLISKSSNQSVLQN
jgi:PPP family 3-phenylpropionic acid transporter